MLIKIHSSTCCPGATEACPLHSVRFLYHDNHEPAHVCGASLLEDLSGLSRTDSGVWNHREGKVSNTASVCVLDIMFCCIHVRFILDRDHSLSYCFRELRQMSVTWTIEQEKELEELFTQYKDDDGTYPHTHTTHT